LDEKYQTHGVPSKVIMPIPSPQMINTTPIMITQANGFLGWSPPIPINLEGQKTRSVVNLGTGVPMAKPYQSTLKYQDYEKDPDPNAHVKAFNAVIRADK
jgi:hypothetical protein